jgi:hypothetical protein
VAGAVFEVMRPDPNATTNDTVAVRRRRVRPATRQPTLAACDHRTPTVADGKRDEAGVVV